MIRRALRVCDGSNVVGNIASPVGKLVPSLPDADEDASHRSIVLLVGRSIDERVVGRAFGRGRLQGLFEPVDVIEGTASGLLAE